MAESAPSNGHNINRQRLLKVLGLGGAQKLVLRVAQVSEQVVDSARHEVAHAVLVFDDIEVLIAVTDDMAR